VAVRQKPGRLLPDSRPSLRPVSVMVLLSPNRRPVGNRIGVDRKMQSDNVIHGLEFFILGSVVVLHQAKYDIQ
jgi:hypothetical protein